ncbi:MAG: YybH family protein [Pseudomarimonas sp.]
MDQPVHRLIEAYRRAVFERDVDAFMRLYDPSARVFDAWDVWSYESADAWRVSVDAWLSSLGDERVQVTAADVQAHRVSPLLVASAVFKYAAISSTGQELRALQNRLTWVLRAEGDGWKIVHEHTSLPVGHEDARAIFQRPGVL